MLTICESGDGTGLSDGDVVIFPDMIKYRYGEVCYGFEIIVFVFV